MTPAAGWVRVHADVQGIKAGKRCQLVVDGWDLVAADNVAAVDVVMFDSEKLGSANF